MMADRDGQSPRAMIHKQILDEAAADPNASMATVADAVAGATVDLVEKVLDEYGDPAAEGTPPPENADDAGSESDPAEDLPETDHDTTERDPARDAYSKKQRETLAAIREQPTATQREIGEALDVCAATVCQRLSDIDGFAWEDRHAFVSGLVEAPLIGDGQGSLDRGARDDHPEDIESLERRLDAIESADRQPVLRPELAHKVIHVCMRSERFSEEEELELIRSLVSVRDASEAA